MEKLWGFAQKLGKSLGKSLGCRCASCACFVPATTGDAATVPGRPICPATILGYRMIQNDSGWWLSHPSEKYEFVSWDDDIPNIWKNNPNVPNHQPVQRYEPFADLFHIVSQLVANVYFCLLISWKSRLRQVSESKKFAYLTGLQHLQLSDIATNF